MILYVVYSAQLFFKRWQLRLGIIEMGIEVKQIPNYTRSAVVERYYLCQTIIQGHNL